MEKYSNGLDNLDRKCKNNGMAHGSGLFSTLFDILLAVGAVGMIIFCIALAIVYPVAGLAMLMVLILVAVPAVAIWKKV
jgi:hypothetical protein